jgi:hypothetical protein
MTQNKPPLTTPDGRYIVVRGRLWRAANPNLPDDVAQEETRRLMDARRQLRRGAAIEDQRPAARAAVQEAKEALGERGPVWWSDGAPDLNRRLAKNSPYRDWYANLAPHED